MYLFRRLSSSLHYNPSPLAASPFISQTHSFAAQVKAKKDVKTLDDIPGSWEKEQTRLLVKPHMFDQFNFWTDQLSQIPPDSKFMKVRVMGHKLVAVLDIELARRVFTMELDGLTQRRFSPWIEKLLAGGSSEAMVLWGKKMTKSDSHRRWRKHHKKAFTAKTVDDYVQHIEKNNELLLAKFQSAHDRGGKVDFLETTKLWSWFNALEIFLSPELLALVDSDMEHIIGLYNIWKNGMSVFEMDESADGPLPKAYAAHNELMHIFAKVLDRAIEMVHKDEIDANSMLFKMVMSDGKFWWEDAQFGGILLINMLFAAHDSLGMACTNMFFDVWKNPHEVEKLKQKLLEYDNLEDQLYCPELIYFVRESLRLHPTHQTFIRYTIKDNIEIAGHVFPKNTLFTIPQGLVHFDQVAWDRPKLFMPSRLDPENGDRNNERYWMPFVFGNHECLGNHLVILELKSILRKVLVEDWSFDFELADDDLHFPFNYPSLHGSVSKTKK